MLVTDERSGLLYQQKTTSADFTPVSIKVADPCLPEEPVNKRTHERDVAILEKNLKEAIASIDTGVSLEEIVRLLQPIKDAIDAAKQGDNGILSARIDKLDKTLAELVKGGIGGVVIHKGASFRYFRLGLYKIDYQEIELCGRKIVTTTASIDITGIGNFTPIALRRISDGRFVESLELPSSKIVDGYLNVYFQGAKETPLGDLELVLAIEDADITTALDSSTSAEILAKIEERSQSEPVLTGDPVPTELSAVEPPTESKAIELPNGSVKLDEKGAVTWNLDGQEEFTSGVQMEEIFRANDRLYGYNGKHYHSTPIEKPSWQKIDKNSYEVAKEESDSSVNAAY